MGISRLLAYFFPFLDAFLSRPGEKAVSFAVKVLKRAAGGPGFKGQLAVVVLEIGAIVAALHAALRKERAARGSGTVRAALAVVGRLAKAAVTEAHERLKFDAGVGSEHDDMLASFEDAVSVSRFSRRSFGQASYSSQGSAYTAEYDPDWQSTASFTSSVKHRAGFPRVRPPSTPTTPPPSYTPYVEQVSLASPEAPGPHCMSPRQYRAAGSQRWSPAR